MPAVAEGDEIRGGAVERAKRDRPGTDVHHTDGGAGVQHRTPGGVARIRQVDAVIRVGCTERGVEADVAAEIGLPTNEAGVEGLPVYA